MLILIGSLIILLANFIIVVGGGQVTAARGDLGNNMATYFSTQFDDFPATISLGATGTNITYKYSTDQNDLSLVLCQTSSPSSIDSNNTWAVLYIGTCY